MRVLLIVQLVDEREWLRGFIPSWIRALAERVDRLDVLTLERGEADLPDNVFVRSMGKERGFGRVRELIEFYRGLWHVIRDVDVILVHMTPRYAWLAAPLAKVFRKPLFLWFNHPRTSSELRLATLVTTHILAAGQGSFPLKTPKLHIMGQGIDVSEFPAPQPEASPPQIVMIGRLAPIKRQDWLLRAASLVAAETDALPFRVRLIGGAVEGEPDTPARLRALAASLDPAPPVEFVGPLPHREALSALAQSALSAGLTPTGSFDKAALEPMVAGKPVIVTNPDFLPLLGDHAALLYLPDDASDAALAGRLAALLALSPDERAAIGADLRARALAAHSLDGLMDRIVALMREAAPHA